MSIMSPMNKSQISRIPKMCAIVQLVSAPLNSIWILAYSLCMIYVDCFQKNNSNFMYTEKLQKYYNLRILQRL